MADVLGVRSGEQRWERVNSGITTAAGEVVLVRGGGTFTALSAADGHEGDGGRIVLSGGMGQRDHSVDVNGTVVEAFS